MVKTGRKDRAAPELVTGGVLPGRLAEWECTGLLSRRPARGAEVRVLYLPPVQPQQGPPNETGGRSSTRDRGRHWRPQRTVNPPSSGHHLVRFQDDPPSELPRQRVIVSFSCIGSTPVGHGSVMAPSKGSTETHDGDGFAVSPHGTTGRSLAGVGHCGTSIKPTTPPGTPAGACPGTDRCTRPKRCRPVAINPFRGCSSAGRAPALQADCRRFDPGHLHQYQHLDLTVQRWFRARFWSGNAVRGQPSSLGVAQLVERVLWEHEAGGSRPSTETIFMLIRPVNSEARVPACLVGRHRFESGTGRHLLSPSVAQRVERCDEGTGAGGSIPPGAPPPAQVAKLVDAAG